LAFNPAASMPAMAQISSLSQGVAGDANRAGQRAAVLNQNAAS